MSLSKAKIKSALTRAITAAKQRYRREMFLLEQQEMKKAREAVQRRVELAQKRIERENRFLASRGIKTKRVG